MIMIMVITNMYIIGTGWCVEKKIVAITVYSTVSLFINYLINYYKLNITFELIFRI